MAEQAILFDCPKCGTQMRAGSAKVIHYLPCPKCGTMVTVPEAPRSPRSLRVLRGLFRGAVVAVACWLLTLVAGPRTLSDEIESVSASIRRNFPNAETRIRSPCPFIVAVRVDAYEVKKGVTTNYKIEKYYAWYGVSFRELPVGDPAPAVLSWVWF